MYTYSRFRGHWGRKVTSCLPVYIPRVNNLIGLGRVISVSCSGHGAERGALEYRLLLLRSSHRKEWNSLQVAL